MKGLLQKIACFIIIGLLFVANDTQAQCFYDSNGVLVNPDGSECINTILTAVPFLRIVSDARSGAMGDVGIGISAVVRDPRRRSSIQ